MYTGNRSTSAGCSCICLNSSGGADRLFFSLFNAQCGLYPLDNDVRIIERVIMNRKTKTNMHRAWIHGRYQKR
jgi:hypothetical protein